MARAIGSDGEMWLSGANLLNTNEAGMEGAGKSSWVDQNGGVCQVTTDPKFEGLQSLQINASATSAGARTNQKTATGNKVYAASMYMRGAVGGESVILALADNQGFYVAGSKLNVVLTTSWKRFVVFHTTDAAATGVYLYSVGGTAVGGAQEWYIDSAIAAAQGVVGRSVAFNLSGSTSAIDVTDNSSGEEREYLQGDSDGTAQMTLNYDINSGSFNTLDAWFYARARHQFYYWPKGNVSGNKMYSFDAYLTGRSIPSAHEAILQQTYDLQLTSEISVQDTP